MEKIDTAAIFWVKKITVCVNFDYKFGDYKKSDDFFYRVPGHTAWLSSARLASKFLLGGFKEIEVVGFKSFSVNLEQF